jgi:NitT/TauT family transport system ATP-binding protein
MSADAETVSSRLSNHLEGHMHSIETPPSPASGVLSAGEPSHEQAAVELADVRFSYGENVVLEGITATIPAGSIVGVVGPSGCGKSTLLALIAGLLDPGSGTVERNLHAGRHPLSMVFQRDTLLPWLTAAENVRLFARFRQHGLRRRIPLVTRRARNPGRSSKQVDARVQELLAQVGLAGQGEKYPYQLSGGMRRRLAFLVAVAAEPELLLLDEPFSSVDEPTRLGIHQDVFNIARHMRMTTILVTHDLAEAISLCDRVFILRKTPSVIVHTHEIPFGEERTMLQIRETPEFLQAYARLWHDLSEQIARGAAADLEQA